MQKATRVATNRFVAALLCGAATTPVIAQSKGPSGLALEEVIVTGVMEGVERSKVPFAVGRVTAEDIPVAAVDPVRALQGKVAGVRIAQTTGYPGSTPEILLRGPTSINASGRGQGPLIIIDDVIMNVGVLTELGGMDIESIEVVKGAAGASLRLRAD